MNNMQEGKKDVSIKQEFYWKLKTVLSISIE